MKVLQINTFIGSTSTGNLTYDIYMTNKKYGNECIIAYGRLDKKSCLDSYQISNKIDYTLHGLWTRITDLNGLGSRLVTRKFIKFIEEYKPDIIHLHNLHGYYLNLPIFFDYLYKKDIPVVWTFHDCWPFTGHCPYYTNIQCEKWKTQCNKCPKKREHPASFFWDNSHYNYNMKKDIFTKLNRLVITPVSNWLANEVKMSYFRDCDIRTIYNGVDLERFKPIRSSLFREKYKLEDKIILLGVAINWVESKGLSDFVKLSKIIDDKYRIVLVGLDSEQRKGLSENIIGLGKTESIEELVEIYSTADIFVNPSKEETFGMVTAEAMACGTPAVVYNTTASPELVDESTGVVVEVGDIVGLYDAIKKIDKADMRSACLTRARDLFDKRKNQKKYLEIYEELVMGKMDGYRKKY